MKRPRLNRPHASKGQKDGQSNGPTDDVGYGKPPRKHQFKPGHSGNPKGRPKGSKSDATLLDELLNRKIAIRVEGNSKKITVREAIYMRFMEAALKGDVKSATFLLNRHGALSTGEAPQPDFDDNDREILESFAKRLLSDQPKRTS